MSNKHVILFISFLTEGMNIFCIYNTILGVFMIGITGMLNCFCNEYRWNNPCNDMLLAYQYYFKMELLKYMMLWGNFFSYSILSYFGCVKGISIFIFQMFTCLCMYLYVIWVIGTRVPGVNLSLASTYPVDPFN